MIKIDTNEIDKFVVDLGQMSNEVREDVQKVLKNTGFKIEASAKANRPWSDRTGRARQSLNGDSEWVGNKVRVSLSHGVDYGIWLELCNEGKYSIIMPTINKEGPAVMEGLKKILK